MDNEETRTGELDVHRAEWIAIAAMILNVMGLVFGGGALWQQAQEHERRIVSAEAKLDASTATMTQILVRLETIDGNTRALRERLDVGSTESTLRTRR